MNKLFTATALLLFCTLQITAQPGALDLSFNPGTGADNTISSIALQPDGKIVAVGYFYYYNGDTISRIMRLNTNGSVDTSFHSGTNIVAGMLYKVLIQPDGKILAAGEIASYAGVPMSGLIRLNTDASLDTSFHIGTGVNATIKSMVLQPDNKIIAVGLFTTYNGIPCGRIVRLNTDGSCDTTFHPISGADGSVESVALQSDGKIIIGGDFIDYDGLLIFRTTRLFADGTHDSTFHATGHPTAIGADAAVYALAVTPTNDIYMGGSFNTIQFQAKSKVGRLHTTGDFDPTFNPSGTGGNDFIKVINLLDNGQLLIGGKFTTFNGTSINRIALLSPSGELEQAFNPGAGCDFDLNTIAIQTNGKIIIGGDFSNYNGIARSKIARLYNCLTPQPDSIYGLDHALCNGTQQTYTVTPISGATKYEWSLPSGWLGSSDSTSITATSDGSGGVITVKAFTDSCGYSYATTRTIATIQPANVPICLVTVDTGSTHNIIIWEKPHTALIDSFFIYRETATNVYTKIGAVPYDSLSEYHDYAANPNATSYRYRLSVLDTCGAESDQSFFHNTIHLQNLGTGNFQWTFYQIEGASNPVMSFNVYRDAFGNGNFFQIGNIPGTNSTFTDVTYSSFPNSIYVVDATWGISCAPTRAVNTTRSNIRHINAIDIPMAITETELLEQVTIYPNPARKTIYLQLPAMLNVVRLQLFNAIGQLALSKTEGDNLKQLEVEKLPAGVYTLSIETNAGKAIKRVVVE